MTREVYSGPAVFNGSRLVPGAALVVEDGYIAEIIDPSDTGVANTLPPGGVIAPGFVDLQVNGGGGVLLNGKPDVAGLRAICESHARLGSLGILPTLITDRPEVARAVVAAGIEAVRLGVPGFLGLHIEGPHLDVRRKGAHDPELIRAMTEVDCDLLCAAARELPALLVTLAPASVTNEQIHKLTQAGVVVSLGHSDCGFEEAKGAFAAGARCVTHLFNAMSPLSHREPGLVGAALDAGGVYVGLIADGVHVAPEVMRIALAGKRNADEVFLVSDAMSVAGTDLTEFTLNGRRILRSEGRLTLDDGTLAGADVDIATSIRTLVRKVGLPLETALRMATSVPAACIGMGETRGALRPGMAADFVYLDGDLTLQGVWRGGERLI